jgi:N-acetylglucosamine-6-phosphate deacetylase
LSGVEGSLQQKLVHSVSLFDGELRHDSWALLTEHGHTSGSGNSWRDLPDLTELELVDGSGSILLSGLVDTHCHGAAGFNAQDGLTGMRAILDFNQSVGVTRSLLSLVSDSHQRLIDRCEQASDLSADERFLGLHLEGPYLSEAHPGAHSHSALRAPTDAEIKELLSFDLVSSITIAPERFSASQLAMLRESGVRVCVGHTAIGYEAALDFFDVFPDAVVTHAFNGMRSMHHREPGLIPAAIERGVFTELIADGVHVHPAVAKLLPSESLILVTDAMSATGMPDGRYSLGELQVVVGDGVARVVADKSEGSAPGSLAGSTLTLASAVANYALWAQDPLAALRAASTNPARAYGVELPELSLENHLLLAL